MVFRERLRNNYPDTGDSWSEESENVPDPGALTEVFLKEPESPSFMEEDLDRGIGSVAEDEERPGTWSA